MTLAITVTDGNNIASYDVGEDYKVEDLIALASAELGSASHRPENVTLMKDGRDLLAGGDRSRKLVEVGIANGDLLMYVHQEAAPSRQPAPVPSSSAASTSAGNDKDAMRERMKALVASLGKPAEAAPPPSSALDDVFRPEKIRQIFEASKSDPNVKANIFAKSPAMLEASNKNNYEAFEIAYKTWMEEEQRKLKAINDPFSAEGQKLIQEMINQQNVESEYQRAMQLNPENFIAVHMLYIRCRVNGVDTVAFIDSGAQVSIMSQHLAEKLQLGRLLDSRFRGMASGVGGTQKFLGRIHSCKIEVGDHFFECKFDVLSDRDMPLLIGLDVMRKHGCCIDLAKNRLVFGDGTSTPFLSDAEAAAHKEAEAAEKTTQDFPITDENIEKVVSMGFPRDDAIKALKASFNDVDSAIHRLFDRTIDGANEQP